MALTKVTKARTKPNAQFHFVSENTLIWFQLRWKQQPSPAKPSQASRVEWQNSLRSLWTTANTWAKFESLSMPVPELASWLNVKLRVSARATCGARLRTVTVTQSQLQLQLQFEYYIWIIEFELRHRYSSYSYSYGCCCFYSYSYFYSYSHFYCCCPATIQFKRLFATVSRPKMSLSTRGRAELSLSLSAGRSFISFGWHVRASHAQSAKGLSACQQQLLLLLWVKHQSVTPAPAPSSCLPAHRA